MLKSAWDLLFPLCLFCSFPGPAGSPDVPGSVGSDGLMWEKMEG